jgi:signal transduction histidine kinase
VIGRSISLRTRLTNLRTRTSLELRTRWTNLELRDRLSNISLRTRLTLIFGGLFLLMGAILEGATYLITVAAVNRRFDMLISSGPVTQINPAPGPVVSGSGPGAGGAGNPGPQFAAQGQIIGAISRERRAILNQLIQSSALALIAVAILAVVLGYIVSGRMLRPLQKITATAQRLSGSNLHERIALTGPHDEIRELADTFDSMLDRLYRAFDAQRRFIANASHELRTPLAINRTLIDVAAAKPDAPEAVLTLAGKLLPTITRQERLLDGLLLLARSERELPGGSAFDLAVLTASAIEQLEPAARAARVTIMPTLSPAPASGDVVLLERCAVNLLENAIKHSSADAHVWVSTGQAKGRAWLQVENTGPQISVEQAETIFQPFRRLYSDRVGSAAGAGLGLSIVQAVVQAHHGFVQAEPRPSGGLMIIIVLPPPTA